MSGWTEEDLRRQFQRAKKNGWLQIFKRAAETYGFPPELIMAIASRETNMRNVIGDGGHGYGIMQIDDRSFPEWCHSGLWKDVAAGIQKGALVLQSKLETIRNGQGKRLSVGGKLFTGKRILPRLSF
jgi:Transglycosylase SLT domain